MRAAFLLAALLIPACRIDPLVGAGRPCSTGEPCGPGTVCLGGRCQPSGVDLADRERAVPADGPLGERRDLALLDGDAARAADARRDQKTDLKKPSDLPPPDQKKPVDLVHPADSGCGVCPLGCDTALNRCKRLLPSGFDPKPFFEAVSKALAVAAGSTVTFNTTTGLVSEGSTTLRPAGNPGSVVGGIYWGTVSPAALGYPGLAVFAVTGLAVASGGTVEVTGDRALALYLTGTAAVAIGGTIRALPSGPTPGAGGFAGGSATGNAGAACFGGEGKPGTNSGGGGGGGRGSVGGKGGMTGGAGGMINGGLVLAPLYGGCGGGAGGANSSPPLGEGGGGGGAIQLASNGPIQVTGTITVPGAGGRHGGEGAGGGGSGGAILLEAPAITVSGSGVLAANGGGGGGGDTNGTDGEDGRPNLIAAQGGNGGTSGGDGGNGGVRGSEAGGIGGDIQDGGGGGGSVGRIRVYALAISVGANSASPAQSQSNSVLSF